MVYGLSFDKQGGQYLAIPPVFTSLTKENPFVNDYFYLFSLFFSFVKAIAINELTARNRGL